jgi:hypothetical protein
LYVLLGFICDLFTNILDLFPNILDLLIDNLDLGYYKLLLLEYNIDLIGDDMLDYIFLDLYK